jgi:NAD(P)-dependent dehydrogenase (short-subunit alcohol dehydrogenase family)
MSLSGKIVAVIGGGTGIGAGIARELAMAGANVTVGGRRSEPLARLAESTDSPLPIRTHTIDVADNERRWRINGCHRWQFWVHTVIIPTTLWLASGFWLFGIS